MTMLIAGHETTAAGETDGPTARHSMTQHDAAWLEPAPSFPWAQPGCLCDQFWLVVKLEGLGWLSQRPPVSIGHTDTTLSDCGALVHQAPPGVTMPAGRRQSIHLLMLLLLLVRLHPLPLLRLHLLPLRLRLRLCLPLCHVPLPQC